MEPWFYLQKLGSFALKPKTQRIGRKKLGFFPTLAAYGRWVGPGISHILFENYAMVIHLPTLLL